MAIQIYADIVKEHSYEEDDRSGSLIRVYLVSGLFSSSRITTDAIYAADANGRVPRAGEAHDTLPDFVVRRVRCQPFLDSRNQIKVYVFYAKVRRRLLDVRINGVTTNTLTNRDKDGNIIVVGYKNPTTNTTTSQNESTSPGTPFPDPKPSNGYEYDYGEVPYNLAEDVLEIVYLEKGSPFAKRKKYRRRLNSKPWQSGDPREWFCEDILGQVDSPIPLNLNQLGSQEVVTGDALFNWVVTYRFRRVDLPPNGPGWDPLVLFTDLQTGRKPNDINPKAGGWPSKSKGNGWYVPKIYDEADFNELNLVSAVKEA